MAGFGDIVQKAFYLGVGIASYAGEKAGDKLSELRVQAQKLVDEMVDRGEMTTEEARRVVDEMVNRAQQSAANSSAPSESSEPRRIEILTDDEPQTGDAQNLDEMRKQVIELQDELRRLKRD